MLLFFFFFPLLFRSVVIHECRFSPENAQLQLQVDSNSTRSGSSSTYPFHSFFSSARRGDRRVITYHMLPSTSNLEHALKEITQGCETLGHLLSMLGASFPEIHNAISNFILSLWKEQKYIRVYSFLASFCIMMVFLFYTWQKQCIFWIDWVGL